MDDVNNVLTIEKEPGTKSDGDNSEKPRADPTPESLIRFLW